MTNREAFASLQLQHQQVYYLTIAHVWP